MYELWRKGDGPWPFRMTTWKFDVNNKLSKLLVCAWDKKHAQFDLRVWGGGAHSGAIIIIIIITNYLYT